MKYKIIQMTDNGNVYEQQTTSYHKMYGIVINMVGLDYSYIKRVDVEEDKVIIHIFQGEGNAILTFSGLKKLYVIHAIEMQKVKRKQMDLLYNHHQEICREFREFNPELINNVKMGIHDL